ncbi:cyclopropane-fatty-acyl-phospholipid synthase [Nannochloropsis oceanica]
MAQRVVDAFNRFVDQKVVPRVQPIVEKDMMPDHLIRLGIRSMLRDMLAEFSSRGLEGAMVAKQAYIDELKSLPIAIDTNAANIQHYEVPTSFYKLVLGPYMKYSCGLWPSSNTSFQDSETEMLELYCQRAELEDGMKILDLGCGWGSVSLFVAKKYPRSQIFSLSNSATQREYIENEAQKRGLTNITVWTADINGFEIPRTTGAGGGGGGAGGLLKALMKKASLSRVAAEEPGEEVLGASSPTTPYTPVTTASADTTKGAAASSSATDADLFDRVISIEMFEHMKNYQKLLAKVSSWLRPGGKLFVHIFTHATTAYHFDKSWMAESFFTGGQMPSQDLLLYFQQDLKIEAQWVVNGKHYSKTNAAWLANLDKNKTEAKALLASIHGSEKATKAFVDWRLFFLTLVECFAMDDGNQWSVNLYRFVKPPAGGNGRTGGSA